MMIVDIARCINSSLHLFNFDWVQELIKGAVGAE